MSSQPTTLDDVTLTQSNNGQSQRGSTEQLAARPSVLIQPREHKARVCLWQDISVHDMDTLFDLTQVDDIKSALSEIFHLEDFKDNLKSAIILDLYFFTFQFAMNENFSKEQASAFFSIVKKTHEVAIETPFGNVEQTFNFFREMVLRHAVKRPPHSIDLFSPDEVRKITEYVINTYFRHFKMYKYVFTPKVSLDLSMTYDGMPPSPEPEPEVEEVVPAPASREGSHLSAADPDAADEAGGQDRASAQPPSEPEVNPAVKELQELMKKHMAAEIGRLKVTITDQIKSSDGELEKRLHEMESSGKGRAGSAKGKKK